ncbi:hypothetical protein Back11_41790 [Paenibacillus baekrokdamisoli]|uniref:Uncharacterized protein n=1 Tax=Paenibacillus baekrokdamisoli TaxID=1712516 RepID=A0A3G9JIN2_9BACL|nr:hypothetical protein [Paenibacillus baekrokdamisoli]MBB3068122.1 chromosome segregation ATPase [Paenibacillus baekrokdamisoli]BBH22834.1 hypothetical protein Back11_41790 [Paenibacillus baekrokdamisoli]
MLDALNAKLAAAKEQGRRHEVWQGRLGRLQQDLVTEEQKLKVCEEQLREEQGDIDRLLKLSFTSLWAALLHNKQEKLAHEEQELLSAKLKHEEALREVKSIQEDIGDLEQKLQGVQYWKQELEQILREKEQIMRNEGTERSIQLHKLEDQRSDLVVLVKELQEAYSAGQTVQTHLNVAIDRMESAKGWGTYDLLGGGILSTHMKHSRVDEAMDNIRNAQNSLRRFQQELSDVRLTLNVRFDASNFLKFSDYFFDGFIADILMQGKIKATLAQIEQKHDEVITVMTQLGDAKRKAEAELAGIERHYIFLIETAEDV